MRLIAPIFWYGMIFATSCTVVHRENLLAVAPVAIRSGFDALWCHVWWIVVKGWHMTEFAILMILVVRAIRDLGWSLFVVSFAAVLDEFHQTFVPGRGGIVSDVLIDLGGAIAAAIILRWRSVARHSETSRAFTS